MTNTPSKVHAEIKNFRDLLIDKGLAIAANEIQFGRSARCIELHGYLPSMLCMF